MSIDAELMKNKMVESFQMGHQAGSSAECVRWSIGIQKGVFELIQNGKESFDVNDIMDIVTKITADLTEAQKASALKIHTRDILQTSLGITL